MSPSRNFSHYTFHDESVSFGSVSISDHCHV